MKKTHLLFDFRRKGGQVQPSDPPKNKGHQKKVHPHPQNILPVPCNQNPVPSTSRDARVILDPFQVPTYKEPPLKVKTSPPKTTETEKGSSNSCVAPNTSTSSVRDVELVWEKVKQRRKETHLFVKVVDDARCKLRRVGQSHSVDELKRKEDEKLVTYYSRLLRMRIDKTREKLKSSWKSLKETKEKWDKWNPDKSHPLVKCINESKMSGLKETIRPNKGIFWRFSWLMTWALAISSGITFFVSAYYFHQHFPILFGFKTKQTPIREVPFTTVTVCPFQGFSPEAIASLEKLLTNVDLKNDDLGDWSQEKIFELMTFVDHICISKSTLRSLFRMEKDVFIDKLYMAMKRKKKLSSQFDMDRLKRIREFLIRISTPREDFLEMCVWNTETDKDCSNFFKPKLTSNGVCYTFNAMPPEELYTRGEAKTLKEDPKEQDSTWKNWNLDKHESKYNNAKEFVGRQNGPRSQPTGGNRWGLKFKVRTDDSLSGNCDQFDGLGPRVFVSVPGLDLDESKLATSIPPNHEVTIKLYPDLTLSDPEIRDIEPERRGCLFQEEKKLNYYKQYTQENCQRECVADHAAETCKCTLLTFPNFPGKPLCMSQEDLICLKTVEENLFTTGGCNKCLPSCSQMTIRDEVMSTPLSAGARRAHSGNKNESFSLVSMFYAPDSIVAKERQRRFSKYELFSVFGSIFESTNDMSLLGFARTLVGLSELKPLVATLLNLIWRAVQAKMTNMLDLIKRKLGLGGNQDPLLPLYDRPSNASNA